MARQKDEALTKVRKTQILDAAAKCFVQYGVHQASMRQICAASKLSAGAVYNYFASKGDIIEAMADRESDQIKELAEYLAKSKNGLKSVVQAAIWIVQDTSLEDAQLQIEILSEASRNAAVLARCQANEKALHGCLHDAVVRGQENGTINKKLKAAELVQIITVIYEGFVGRIAVEGDKNRKQMVRLTEHSLLQLLKA